MGLFRLSVDWWMRREKRVGVSEFEVKVEL